MREVTCWSLFCHELSHCSSSLLLTNLQRCHLESERVQNLKAGWLWAMQSSAHLVLSTLEEQACCHRQKALKIVRCLLLLQPTCIFTVNWMDNYKQNMEDPMQQTWLALSSSKSESQSSWKKGMKRDGTTTKLRWKRDGVKCHIES